LQSLRFQTAQSLVQRLFQFLKRGFGVVRIPLFDFNQQGFAHLPPGLIEGFIHALPPLPATLS
jgi:hypothetical protein